MDLADFHAVAEEASPVKLADYRMNLSSKRTGTDTCFWIVNSNETESMLYLLKVRSILFFIGDQDGLFHSQE